MPCAMFICGIQNVQKKNACYKVITIRTLTCCRSVNVLGGQDNNNNEKNAAQNKHADKCGIS